MKVLVTAFDPFGGESVNPALQAVEQLPDMIEGHTIDKLEVPTVFHQCMVVVREKLKETAYDVVIAVGQAGGRYEITPERIAINIDDARIPDNQGQQPIDQPIQQAGAPAYFTSLPVKRMVEAIRAKGIPARLSNSAGTFVCNHMMYQLAFEAATHYPHMRTGFIHVPFAPAQVVNKPEKPSMAIDMMVTGLLTAIKVCLDYDTDIAAVQGETH
ncbi:pyroglutamyl-peptidase I [Staphylococcus lutrae]|uniref:Pyrrolidone-carboxylate peptidase n=1 Tax=Staphylococcus lutrae TaxID=155085 RepID=A0AAC9RNK3_9STAP|nr:pyroglutamyl-peptidase I [Staphylococcus lutrae]ARJ50466.1 pyroglutamyl-peptidase I [Staphylococcus lutrae]PNZ38195.1 pyroglutamyl-peptidase I [Staphylococcus lutrae]